MNDQRNLFKDLEKAPPGTQIPIQQLLTAIPWNFEGLIPAIVQDDASKIVLMMAWVNHEALVKTLETKKANYWSRSRQALWCKGETSGHTQTIVAVALDCDGDTLLYRVNQTGPACHTFRSNCFFWDVTNDGARMTPST